MLCVGACPSYSPHIRERIFREQTYSQRINGLPRSPNIETSEAPSPYMRTNRIVNREIRQDRDGKSEQTAGAAYLTAQQRFLGVGADHLQPHCWCTILGICAAYPPSRLVFLTTRLSVSTSELALPGESLV
jgi:hypothetical protein